MSLDNSATFVGRMAALPEPLGTTGVKFRLGVDKWNKQQGKSTVWVPFVAWGKDADLVRQHVSVGRQIAIRAEYDPREYEWPANSGQKRLDPQFRVLEIKLLAESQRNAGQFSGDPVTNPTPDPTHEPSVW